MSFLEMTKLHLARQESEKPGPEARVLDGRFVKRVLWETGKIVVFQDSEGSFWQYIHGCHKSKPALIVTVKKTPLTPSP